MHHSYLLTRKRREKKNRPYGCGTFSHTHALRFRLDVRYVNARMRIEIQFPFLLLLFLTCMKTCCGFPSKVTGHVRFFSLLRSKRISGFTHSSLKYFLGEKIGLNAFRMMKEKREDKEEKTEYDSSPPLVAFFFTVN